MLTCLRRLEVAAGGGADGDWMRSWEAAREVGAVGAMCPDACAQAVTARNDKTGVICVCICIYDRHYVHTHTTDEPYKVCV